MSDTKKASPLEVFERAVGTMRAFGYVDRPWIARAYGAFLDRQEKKKDKPEKKKSWLVRLFGWLPFVGEREIPPSQRIILNGRKPASFELLRAVMAHVPDNSAGPGARRRRAPEPLEALCKRFEEDEQKLVAKFLRESGLAETGFPVRLIGEQGERPAPQKQGLVPAPQESAEAHRAGALSALTGGLLYRFAYDSEGPLKWEDAGKVFRSGGLYRVFICPPEQSYVEQRLILIHLEDDGAIIRAAEIRRRSTGYALRGGYVVPASGVNTLILSSDFSPETIGDLVEAILGPEEREALLAAAEPETRRYSSFLQEHQLGFYTLLNRGGGEVRGSVLDGPAPGGVVGYRIEREELGSLAEAPLGLMTGEDVERLQPRDRILIAQTSHSPSVSIELG